MPTVVINRVGCQWTYDGTTVTRADLARGIVHPEASSDGYRAARDYADMVPQEAVEISRDDVPSGVMLDLLVCYGHAIDQEEREAARRAAEEAAASSYHSQCEALRRGNGPYECPFCGHRQTHGGECDYCGDCDTVFRG